MTGTGVGGVGAADHPRRNRRRRRRRTVLALGAGAVALAVIAIGTVVLAPRTSGAGAAATDPASATGHALSVAAAGDTSLTPEQVARLPEARYDAVIPGLSAYASDEVPPQSHEVYTISTDTPIYDDARRPVARFAFRNFAGRPTVIVPVRVDGPWTLVMTPARQNLPSAAGGSAPAQTAGWVPSKALHPTTVLDRRVVISTGRQTLSIEDFSGTVVASFSVAVGAPGTPTPTGVTGYLQERYLDPRQGQSTHPIQLTSLHSSTRDEPYQGEDGGLIGIHYFATSTGNVSHGCIRLPEQAIVAVDALPLGTSVTIMP